MNLLGSIQIAICDRRERSSHPPLHADAERLLNLIASDIGRPISHITPNVDCPGLEQLMTHAIDTVSPQGREVQDRQGNWYSLRVQPYENVENRIDGAVPALFDVQAANAGEGDPGTRPRHTDAIFDAMPLPLLLLDERAHVQRANPAFCSTFFLAEQHRKKAEPRH